MAHDPEIDKTRK